MENAQFKDSAMLRFSLKNPNRLRSVVSVFIMSPQFHLPDGSGYDFALEMIPKVDALNPQARGNRRLL